MEDKQVFEYAIIRYVPKVEREEFINIGVILFCKQISFLDLKYTLNESKIRCINDEAEITEIESHLNSWWEICHGKSENNQINERDISYRFRWITAPKSTIIQCSKVHPGITIDPGKELVGLFEKYVE